MSKVALFIVTEQANDVEVIEALAQADVTAYTKMKGTGTGVWQTLSRWVDPEKLIIMAVIDETHVQAATEALKTTGRLSEPGVGVCFLLPVLGAFGTGIPEEQMAGILS